MTRMITPLLPDDAGEDVLAVWNRCEASLAPGEGPIGLSELRERRLHPGGKLHTFDWFVERDDAGYARGLAQIERLFLDTNREIAECQILVDPAWRRHGVGRRLLAVVLDVAEADARTSLIGWGPTTQACAGFWTNFGLERRYTERVTRADLHQIDAALMRRWIESATPRAGAFNLVYWRGACPQAYRERYAEAETGLNDAPLDELDLGDWAFDAAYMAERDRVWLESGAEPWVLLALEKRTGAAAAMTVVLVSLHDPTYAEQWTTVVLPEHRGQGLGRLLKATMYERLRKDQPQVRFLDTWNGDSNATMLSINEELGFRPFREFAAWQGAAATVRRNLRAIQRA